MPKTMRKPSVFLIVTINLIACFSERCSVADDDTEHLNTFELMMAAGASLAAEKIDDAGFLFYAAQARYQIDKQVYPPDGKGGNGPGVLKAALGFSVGKPIVSAVTGNPTAYANVISRLSKWTPQFEENYDPGWKYQDALDKDAATKVATKTLAKMLVPLLQKAKLLNNEEYRKLTDEVGQARAVQQRYWAADEAAYKATGKGSVDDSLAKELRAALAKKKKAAQRMQEIEWQLNPGSRWHQLVSWKAEDYFDGPQIIKLCHAIEKNDVDEMNRLIAEDADVNAVGKDGMTLLLWAFPDHKPERFECLLKHGADPNVLFKSDFGVKYRPFHPIPGGENFFEDRGCHLGQSVTHLACRSPKISYMQLVFAHGGNANLIDKKTKETPLSISICRGMPDMKKRTEILLGKGADLIRRMERDLSCCGGDPDPCV